MAPHPPFLGLPADLAAAASSFDSGMRREMRWVAGSMLVVGFCLAAYIAAYAFRQGRLWAPRQEEWLPALIAMTVGMLGGWLWRYADRALLVRGLVARFPEVRHVHIKVMYRRYGRSTWLVFEPKGPGLNALLIGNMPAKDPQALHLLAEAQRACPQAREAKHPG